MLAHVRPLVCAIGLACLFAAQKLAGFPSADAAESTRHMVVDGATGSVFAWPDPGKEPNGLRLFITERNSDPSAAYIMLDSLQIAHLEDALAKARRLLRMPPQPRVDPSAPVGDFVEADAPPLLVSMPPAIAPSKDVADSLVLTRVLVNRRGVVDRAAILWGNPSLHATALDLASRALFKPGLSASSPMPAWTLLSIRFSRGH